MADITKCNDIFCPMKESCFRFKAPSSMWQSYFMESPRKGKECDYHMVIFEKPDKTVEDGKDIRTS